MPEKNINQDQKKPSFILSFLKWFGIYLLITAAIYGIIFTIILLTQHK